MFSNPTARQINLGLTTLRVTIGIIFIAHGAQKIFTYGFDGVAGSFGQMGIPLAAVAGPAVALLEFFGGMALVAGLLTRLVSVGLATTMIGAIMFVHLKNGFFAPNGIEFVLALFASAIMLALTGAGNWSVDGLIARRTGRGAEAATRAPISARRAA